MFNKLYWTFVPILAFSLLGFDQDQPRQTNPAGPKLSISVSVPLVTLDVSVITKNGMFVPGLKQENFRVLEDSVPQTIARFNQTQAPIAAAVLVEFPDNNDFFSFGYDSLVASYTFAQTLKKDDWISMITYDLQAHVVQDFTQDKQAIGASISTIRPGAAKSPDTSLFDTLYATLDRLETLEGRKYIILVSSGCDTSSKRTLEQVLKKVQASPDIVIYSVSTEQALRSYTETHSGIRYPCLSTDFNCSTAENQAENQMLAFARMTGGKSYRPLFQAQFREAFLDIGNNIRNQYVLAYHPTNRAQDGSFRKIKVQLIDESGQPLRLSDSKGKDMKYQIVSREGYKAQQGVD